MNRRDFLRKMLCAAGVAAAPKFIFDMGANLYKRELTIADFQYDIKTIYAPVVISGREMDHLNDSLRYNLDCLYKITGVTDILNGIVSPSLPPGMATKQLLN